MQVQAMVPPYGGGRASRKEIRAIEFQKEILARPEGKIRVRRTGSTLSRISTDNAAKNFFWEGVIWRPLKNAQFCSSSRKAKILTTGIHGVF